MARITVVIVAIVVFLSLVVVGGTLLATQPDTQDGGGQETNPEGPTTTMTANATVVMDSRTSTESLSVTGTLAATPTTAPTSTATLTPTATPTPTPTATPLEARELDTDAVANELAQMVNEERDQQGLPALSLDTTSSRRVAEMATNHSQHMAQEQRVTHYQGSASSRERYEQNDLYDLCKFQHDNGYIATASAEQLEIVGDTDFSGINDGGPVTDETNRQVARSLIRTLTSEDDQMAKLLYTNAQYVGTGVAIGDNGNVYATVNVC